MKMSIKLLIFFTLILIVYTVAESTTEEVTTEVLNKTIANGKTYFLQFKKTGESDYVKINHYKKEGIKKEIYDVPEQIRVKPADVQFKDILELPSIIDEEWSYNVNHSMYDLPNITYEIYEAMLENNKHNTIKNATTVKFFFETETNLTSNMIKFDLESLQNITEVIVDAELHVYRLPRETKPNTTDNVVRLYQLTDEDEGNSTEIKPPDVHKLANVIYISSNYAGWQVFKVKNVIENWLKGEENFGFLISTMDSNENEFTVSFAHRENNGGKYQPTLVVYLDRQETLLKKAFRRALKPLFKPSKSISELLKKTFNPCTRHVWYISFHELGWNNFIIAPHGYMAYKCKGSCNSPVINSYTNHGRFLKILKRMGNSDAPCCVPESYKSLTIMYYDKKHNVVIKEYEDMIVNNCECR